jgi:hypothetical protein
MHEVLHIMHSRDTLFGPDAALWECAHPMPAVARGARAMVFARRHTGEVVRRLSTNGGVSWQAPSGAVIVVWQPTRRLQTSVCVQAARSRPRDGKIVHVRAGRARIWHNVDP